jgi:hypothetical protein
MTLGDASAETVVRKDLKGGSAREPRLNRSGCASAKGSPHLISNMSWPAVLVITVATTVACDNRGRVTESSRVSPTPVCIAFSDPYLIAEGDTVTEWTAPYAINRANRNPHDYG